LTRSFTGGWKSSYLYTHLVKQCLTIGRRQRSTYSRKTSRFFRSLLNRAACLATLKCDSYPVSFIVTYCTDLYGIYSILSVHSVCFHYMRLQRTDFCTFYAENQCRDCHRVSRGRSATAVDRRYVTRRCYLRVTLACSSGPHALHIA